jgi:hypothetical protein
MKKSFVLSLVLFLFCVNYTDGQLSKLVKNVKNNVQKELLGNKNQTPVNNTQKTLPEPASACADAQVVFDLGGKLKVDYSEISITVENDGRLLVQDRVSTNYYIVKDAVTQGPYAAGDPALVYFGVNNNQENNDDTKSDKSYEDPYYLLNRDYISKVGDKYQITFMGKNYGTYAKIQEFVVTKSKQSFAAIALENIVVTEDLAKKMDEAMKNAKTDQEKMNLSIQFAQQMQANMIQKGPKSTSPKFITNIPGATFDPMSNMGGKLSGNLKYDDVLLYYYDKITDLKGNMIMAIDQSSFNPDEFFISSDNSNYARYNYGTITFKNESTLPEVFNPHWLKADGKLYIAYMYYSPKRNSIMQCKVPF